MIERRDNVPWLVNTPCNDLNFKSALEQATTAEVERAIVEVQPQAHSKTKLTVLERALKKKKARLS